MRIRNSLALVVVLIAVAACAKKEASRNEVASFAYGDENAVVSNETSNEMNAPAADIGGPVKSVLPETAPKKAKASVASTGASPTDNDVVVEPAPPPPQKPKKPH